MFVVLAGMPSEDAEAGGGARPDSGDGAGSGSESGPSGIETLFDILSVNRDTRRLSSDWESTRLKIELSPVQIGEAAFHFLLRRVSSLTSFAAETTPCKTWTKTAGRSLRSRPAKRRLASLAVVCWWYPFSHRFPGYASRSAASALPAVPT